jgi:2-hydroxy-6-oxonona-2,4-dienedioate hydrolase
MTVQNITVDGVNIRIRTSSGSSVPVLLCGGIGSSLEFWDQQFEALGDELRLIAWDYPGHGLSDMGQQPYEPDSYAAFALNLLDTLGLDRVVLVGNSLGGTIGLRLAGLAPERVAGMVLISPAMTGKDVFAPFKIMSLPVLGELMNKPSESGVTRQIAAIFKKGFTPSEDFRAVVRRNIFKPGADKAFVASLRLTLGLAGVRKEVVQKSRENLMGLQCPVVFVHGRDDMVLPFKQSEECNRLAPNSQLVVLDDCGHTAQIEKPEVVNDLIQTMVQSVAGASAAQTAAQ